MMRTRRLYHEDPELRTFEGTVVSAVPAPGKSWDLVLDRTAFYPTGGGQPADRGTLAGLHVLDVFEAEEVIVHRVNGRPEGATALGVVDWGRRSDHRQQHTGQHLLSRAFVDTAGAATVGFHLGAATCTIDLDREVDADGIETAERLANRQVLDDLPVVDRRYARSEDLPPGLRKEVPLAGEIRVIAIGTFDATPCCGTHCASSARVGPIKILRWERHRAGIRVEFVCGDRAIADYGRRHRALREMSTLLTTEDLEVPVRVRSLLAEHKALRTRLEATLKELMEKLVQTWVSEEPGRPLARTLPPGGAGRLPTTAGTLAERRGGPVLLGCEDDAVARVALGLPGTGEGHAGRELGALLAEFGGKGGGSERIGQGKLPVAELPRLLERWVTKGDAR